MLTDAIRKTATMLRPGDFIRFRFSCGEESALLRVVSVDRSEDPEIRIDVRGTVHYHVPAGYEFDVATEVTDR